MKTPLCTHFSFFPSHSLLSSSRTPLLFLSFPLSFCLMEGFDKNFSHPHWQLLPWLCRHLQTTWDDISMDTDQDDTELWGVGGRQFTGVSSSVCWRPTEGDRAAEGGGGRRGGLEKILNREQQELEKEWTWVREARVFYCYHCWKWNYTLMQISHLAFNTEPFNFRSMKNNNSTVRGMNWGTPGKLDWILELFH